MKPQIALTPDQMHELQSLGLDCSDASMCWINGVLVADCDCSVMTALRTLNPPIPAYTLEDIISKLLMKLDWVPRVDKPMKWQSCRFGKYFYADTPLDAAFVMLKYAVKNHPDKIKKL